MIEKLLCTFKNSFSKKKNLGKLAILNLVILTSFTSNAQYCDYTMWDADYEYITNVTFAGINNTTGSVSGYSQNFTSLTPANVNIGSSYLLSVSIVVDEYDTIDVFIDWNQNGVLDDNGEVYTLALDAMADGTYTTNIIPPSAAVTGVTRMRVMLVYDREIEGPDPCESYWEFGEVEDYSVLVSPALGTSSFDKTAFVAYPNPVKNVLNVNYKSDINEAKIYNLLGQEVFSKTIDKSNFQLDLSHLNSGNYIVKFSAIDGMETFKITKE